MFSDEPKIHSVRFREIASRDLNDAIVYIARITSEETARDWHRGIRAEIATLATLPRRCPLARESFRIEVRQLLYSRPKSKVVYRVLFTIEGEEAEAPEAPTVALLAIRRAAAKPLTRAEIRRIEAAE